MSDGVWVCLFSGGKDSSWALHRALEADLSVERLLTVHPEDDSYLYHVPATDLAGLAADSTGIELVEITPDPVRTDLTGSNVRGDAELEPLERALECLDETLEGGLAGIIAGAIESEFQESRIDAMCERLGIDLFAPLWRRDSHELATEMVAAGFEITVIAVAARGLDESWLGRTLDSGAFAELERLNEEFGVHPLGEGGEFETLVTDAPHMGRPIEFEYETDWDGMRGRLRITDASLGER